MQNVYILSLAFLVLVCSGCLDNSQFGDNCVARSADFMLCNSSISSIKEIPIKNKDGKIENIEFVVNLYPPVPDGTYVWNPCILYSVSPHQVDWPNGLLRNESWIGACWGSEWGHKEQLMVSDNTFRFTLDPAAIEQIVRYKVNGPYRLLDFWDYVVSYKTDSFPAVKLNLDYSKIFTYRLYNDNYYQTKDYTYAQFIDSS